MNDAKWSLGRSGKYFGLLLFLGGLTVSCLFGILWGLVDLGILLGFSHDITIIFAMFGAYIFQSLIFIGFWVWRKKMAAILKVESIKERMFLFAPGLSEYRALKFAYYLLIWLGVGGTLCDKLLFLTDKSIRIDSFWFGEPGFNLYVYAWAISSLILYLSVAFVGFKRNWVSYICCVAVMTESFSAYWVPRETNGPFSNVFSGAAYLVIGCLLLQSFDTKLTQR